MPTLSNPKLTIQVVSGTSKLNLTATVKVEFTSGEKSVMQAVGKQYRLRCHLWGKDVGEDSGTTGSNDPIQIPGQGQWINTDGTKTFSFVNVESSLLDEDDQFQDEIIARFTCVPALSMVMVAAIPQNSPKVTGSF